MIRAVAVDKDTVHVVILSHDFKIIQQEKETLKSAIPARDRYWNGRVWVVERAQSYQHLWFIDHALRQIMVQGKLPMVTA
jgi:hypothetical protein